MRHPAPRRRLPAARRTLVALAASVLAVLVVAATPVPGAADPAPDGRAPAQARATTGVGPGGQTLTVDPVTGLDPAGAELTVTGEGFDAAAGFDVATDGLYVALCVDNGVGQTPTPCVGGVDLTGSGSASRWVTNNPIAGVPAAAVTPMAADGSFSTTITVTAADRFVDCTTLPAGKQCKVFTRLDHRASGDRSQDVRVPVSFGTPAPNGPALAVTPSSGLDPDGTDLTVTGTGFPAEAPGAYVVFGPVPEDGTDATPYGVVTFVPSSAIGPDGSFTATLPDVAAAYTDGGGTARDFSDGGGHVSTFRAHGVPDPDGRWSASVPVAFAGAAVPATMTTLAASAGSVAVGAPVVLTATVTTAAGPVTAGTVDVRSGTTLLGTAELDARGRATVRTSFPTPGARTLTAAFRGSAVAGPSSSAPVGLTVTAATPPPTNDDPAPTPVAAAPSGARTGTGPAGQTLTVTPVDDLDPAGTEVEVTGAGYDAAAGFDLASGGMYVALCIDKGPTVAPSPCVGGVDTEGSSGASRWVTNDPYEGVPDDAVVPVAPDGSFRTTLTLEASDEYVDCTSLRAGERCVVATRADHRASADRSQDVKVPVCFAGEQACTTDPVAPGDPDAAPAFTGFGLDAAAGSGVGGLPPGGGSLGSSGLGPSGGLPLASTGGGVEPLPYGIALVAGGLALLVLGRRLHRARARPVAVPVGRA